MKDIVSIENVSFEYMQDETPVNVLENVDLKIKQGEFVVVIGHNGCGKSTLAKHLNCILKPTNGNVYIKGINTKEEEHIWDIRQSAGMVFQNPDNQIVATIVEEDVAFGPENLGINPAEIRRRVDESLKSVGMYEFRRKPPHLLSGGQKQRVAIAGIIAMKPSTIILDEPTAMLDPSGREEVMNTIKKLNKEENITIIHITHFMEEAISADRVVVMEKGSVIMQGTPKEVFSNVQKLKSIGLTVPYMTELAYELKKDGLDIDKHILSIDEMVMNLCRYQ